MYTLNVTIHLLAAILWLGGMFFFAAVGAPVLRRIEPKELRARLFRELGEGFRLVGWIAIAVLLVTGVVNLHYRGLLSWAALGDPRFWSSAYGVTLAWKLVSVGVMVAASAVHDFVLGPRASRLDPGSEEAVRARRHAALIARVNAIVGVGLVLAAVQLSRGF